jgi:hypothetical protein
MHENNFVMVCILFSKTSNSGLEIKDLMRLYSLTDYITVKLLFKSFDMQKLTGSQIKDPLILIID